MCKFYKFYICAVVGVIIEQLDNMHGITMKITVQNLKVIVPKKSLCMSLS